MFSVLRMQKDWGILISSRNCLPQLLVGVHLLLGFTSAHCLPLLPSSSNQSRSPVVLMALFVHSRAQLLIS